MTTASAAVSAIAYQAVRADAGALARPSAEAITRRDNEPQSPPAPPAGLRRTV
jgi:hypothetical protein